MSQALRIACPCEQSLAVEKKLLVKIWASEMNDAGESISHPVLTITPQIVPTMMCGNRLPKIYKLCGIAQREHPKVCQGVIPEENQLLPRIGVAEVCCLQPGLIHSMITCIELHERARCSAPQLLLLGPGLKHWSDDCEELSSWLQVVIHYCWCPPLASGCHTIHLLVDRFAGFDPAAAPTVLVFSPDHCQK